MPRGRTINVAAIRIPMTVVCSAAARACSACGIQLRRIAPRAGQKPHTTAAPRMAPLLLPDPPTINIAQS